MRSSDLYSDRGRLRHHSGSSDSGAATVRERLDAEATEIETPGSWTRTAGDCTGPASAMHRATLDAIARRALDFLGRGMVFSSLAWINFFRIFRRTCW